MRGIAPDATYQFKHALIRDAAYEALLKSRRKELHLIVARTIDEKFPAFKETHPEVLARHWTEAGEIEAAIAEWTRAGKAAEARNAFKEAQESLQQALALLNRLPESPERDGREVGNQGIPRSNATLDARMGGAGNCRGCRANRTAGARGVAISNEWLDRSGRGVFTLTWRATFLPPLRQPTKGSTLPSAKARLR